MIYRNLINILIGLTLINMFIKTKQISYSLETRGGMQQSVIMPTDGQLGKKWKHVENVACSMYMSFLVINKDSLVFSSRYSAVQLGLSIDFWYCSIGLFVCLNYDLVTGSTRLSCMVIVCLFVLKAVFNLLC